MSAEIIIVENPFEPHFAKIIEVSAGTRVVDIIDQHLHIDVVEYSCFKNTKRIEVTDDLIVSDGDRISVCVHARAAFGGAIVSYIASSVAAVGTAAFWAKLTINFVIGLGLSKIISLLADKPRQLNREENEQLYRFGPLQPTSIEGNAIPILYGQVRTGGQIIQQWVASDATGFSYDINQIYLDYVEFVWEQTYPEAPIGTCKIRHVLRIEDPNYPGPTVITRNRNNVAEDVCNAEDSSDLVYTQDEIRAIILELYPPSIVNPAVEYYNVLIAMCGHEVEFIGNLFFNGQPQQIWKNMALYPRYGTLDDDPFPAGSGFDEILTQTITQTELKYNNPTSFITTSDIVKKITVEIIMPNGCTKIVGGQFDPVTVTFTLQYSVPGSGIWNYFPQSSPAPDYDISITANTQREIRKFYSVNGLTPGQYEIRITKTTADPSESTDFFAIYMRSVTESIDGYIQYPGIAKYGMSTPSGPELYGNIPDITIEVARDLIQIGESYYDSYNPAWICYHMLVEYGNIPPERILYDEFLEWALYCSEIVDGEPRFRVGVLFSSVTNLWDALSSVANLARGVIVKRGTYFGVFVERDENIVTHVFGMGNIIAETLQVQYIPKIDTANVVEVSYRDPDREYTRQVATAADDSFFDIGSISKKTSIDIDAVISRGMAERHAEFILRSNQYLTKIIEFEASIDSFACSLGDLIYFQHVAVGSNRGISGRLISGDGYTFVLDTGFRFEPGTDYVLILRNSKNDDIQMREIVNPGIFTDVISTTTEFDFKGEKYDLYDVSEQEKKSYKIVNIDRNHDNNAVITAINYAPEIYVGL